MTLRHFSLIAMLLVLLLPMPVSAAWHAGGVPLSPMPASEQLLYFPAIAADGSGGAIGVWMLEDFSTPGTHLYSFVAQRVDQNGNRPPSWPAAGTTIRTWSHSAPVPDTYLMEQVGLYPAGSSGAVFAARDYTNDGRDMFQLYRITTTGSVAPILIGGTSPGYRVHQAAVDGDGADGVVMVAVQQTVLNGPSEGRSLFAQRVTGAGAELWPKDAGTNGVQLNAVGQIYGGVAALSDGAGGGFFAWSEQREPGDPDLYVQHLDAAGALAPGWPAGGVLVCGAAGEQVEPHLALDGAGGVIVLWRDDPSGLVRPGLFGHIVLAGGTLAPGIPADGVRIPSSHSNDLFGGLASDGSGGCYVERRAIENEIIQGDWISHLHRLDAALQARPGWPAEGIALHTVARSGARDSRIVGDGLGGAYVCFQNPGYVPTAHPHGVYVQHFTADGSVAPGWETGGYRLDEFGGDAQLIRSGTAVIAAWNGGRDDGRDPYRGIYAQRLLTDGPVPALLDLVSASAATGGVALRWYSADGPGLSATLERSAGGADFAFLAVITADGSGFFEYEDAAVTPGTRYGYRLVWRDGAATRTSPATWIDVPRVEELALEAPSPNPSSGSVALAITLPDARHATLQVFDLAGRRVANRDLAGLGAGRHVVTLREAASLAPGLYEVQLAQAGMARRTKLVRVR